MIIHLIDGPYSTEVEEAIDEMKSFGAVEVEPAFDGFGVILSPGNMASFPTQRSVLSPDTMRGIEHVCRFLRHKNIGQVERLATAAWIRTREGTQDADAVA